MARAVPAARIVVGSGLGKCVDMASASSRITFTVPAALDPAALTALTFAVWLFPRAVDGTARRIIEPNGGAGAGIQMFISASAGVAVRVQHSVTNAEQDSGQGTILRGQWSRVVMTWADGDSVPKLYINALQYATVAYQTPKSGVRNTWSGSTCYLGNTSGLSAAFNGLKDEPGIWPRVWTAAEIGADYYACQVPAGAVWRYPMEDGIGSGTVADGAGSATGTATNVTQGVASYSVPARTLYS